MDNGRLLPKTNIIIGNGLNATKVSNVISNTDEYGNLVYQNRGDDYILLEVGVGHSDTTVHNFGESKPIDVTFTRPYYNENDDITVNTRVDKLEKDTIEVLSIFSILKNSIENNPTVKSCWEQLVNVMTINRDQTNKIEEFTSAIKRKGLG